MKTMKSIFGLTFILLVSLSACNKTGPTQSLDEMIATAEKVVDAVTVEQLMQKLDEGEMIMLIDVREPNEFNPGYIPGAVNIPRGVIEFKIGNEDFWDAAMLYMPEKNEEIIVYCKKGKRSLLAGQTLKKLGYTNVTYVEGGWKKWELTYPDVVEKNLDAMGHDDGGEVGGC